MSEAAVSTAGAGRGFGDMRNYITAAPQSEARPRHGARSAEAGSAGHAVAKPPWRLAHSAASLSSQRLAPRASSVPAPALKSSLRSAVRAARGFVAVAAGRWNGRLRSRASSCASNPLSRCGNACLPPCAQTPVPPPAVV
jgi:hypothetical protein